MSVNLKVIAISGSLRLKSHNTALLESAKVLSPENMEIEIFSLKDIPLYNEDVEKEGVPESVKIFKDKIANSDSMLIASPEYNYSFTGVLKNAIDWASRPPSDSPLKRKPYALMGVSGGISGTIRSQMHFRQVAFHNDMAAMNRPEVYVTNGRSKFNENNELTDEPTILHLTKFLKSFCDWTILNKSRLQ